jgi:hypothetical protein
MKMTFLFQLLLFTSQVFSQKVINYEIPVAGNIYLAKEIVIPTISKGYTVWLPDSGKINGLVLFTHARRDTVKSEFIIDYALRNQLAVMYATTENRLEFFFDKEKVSEILNYINEIVTSHQIPQDNLLFCGMSLEGTRALKLAMYGQSKNAKYKLLPKAIAICDSPLDMVRFHKEMVKAKLLNYTPVTANEGRWVSEYLESNLGGTPKDTLVSYINYSPFCYIADGGPNLKDFKNIAIRAYTEPDVNWWIETRRKDYYAMNAIDLAGFINDLKIIGNQNAELIITQNKGYNADGSRHPHNWSIVDEKDLIDWFVKLIN